MRQSLADIVERMQRAYPDGNAYRIPDYTYRALVEVLARLAIVGVDVELDDDEAHCDADLVAQLDDAVEHFCELYDEG